MAVSADNQDFEAFRGFPLRLVEAISLSSFSLIDLAISLDAPLRLLALSSPRLTASAAPAAFCWACDFAGMSVTPPREWGSNQRARGAFPPLRREVTWVSGSPGERPLREHAGGSRRSPSSAGANI